MQFILFTAVYLSISTDWIVETEDGQSQRQIKIYLTIDYYFVNLKTCTTKHSNLIKYSVTAVQSIYCLFLYTMYHNYPVQKLNLIRFLTSALYT